MLHDFPLLLKMLFNRTILVHSLLEFNHQIQLGQHIRKPAAKKVGPRKVDVDEGGLHLEKKMAHADGKIR